MMRDRFARAAMIFAIALGASPAVAQEQPTQATQSTQSTQSVIGDAEIQLKNGSSVHGTLVSVEPGQRVIVIVEGAQSEIPWSDVAQIVGSPKKAPNTDPPRVSAATTSPAVPPTPERRLPTVHIESNWPEAELHRVDGGIGYGAQSANDSQANRMFTRFMCVAPCDKAIDSQDGNRFFIAAPGMFPTNEFRLHQYDGPVTARVKGVSFLRVAGGVVAVTMGGTLALGGAALVGFSFVPESKTSSTTNPTPERDETQMRAIGLVVGSVGIIALTGGVMLLSGGLSRVEIIPAKGRQTGLMLDGGTLRF